MRYTKILFLILFSILCILFVLILFPHPPMPPHYSYAVLIKGDCTDLELLVPMPMDNAGKSPIKEKFEIVKTIHGKMIKLNLIDDTCVQHKPNGSIYLILDDGLLDKNPDIYDPINNSIILHPVDNITYVGLKNIFEHKEKQWHYETWVFRKADRNLTLSIEFYAHSKISFWQKLMNKLGLLSNIGNYRVISKVNLPAGEGWVKVKVKVVSEIW